MRTSIANPNRSRPKKNVVNSIPYFGPVLVAAATAVAGLLQFGTLGMAGSLVSFDAMDAAGARNVVAKVVSDDAARASLEGILDGAKAAADRMLVEHRHVAEALRDALLERDELIADEITAVIDEARARHHAGVHAEIDLRASEEALLRP